MITFNWFKNLVKFNKCDIKIISFYYIYFKKDEMLKFTGNSQIFLVLQKLLGVMFSAVYRRNQQTYQ